MRKAINPDDTWTWGPVRFDGLMGLHGLFICFHRPDPDQPEAVIVDPAKAITPLEPDPSYPLPDFVETA